MEPSSSEISTKTSRIPRDLRDVDSWDDEAEDAFDSQPSRECENLSLDEIVQKNVSQNIRELRAFFSSGKYTTEKNDQNTNVINVAEKKTYCVPCDQMETLFTMLDACRKESMSVHYSERQVNSRKQKSGIMIDFDCNQKSGGAQINSLHLQSLTRRLSRLIFETLDIPAANTLAGMRFVIFYIRKPKITSTQKGDETIYRDGFHVLIPELQVTKGYKRYLNQELVKRGVVKGVFADIDHTEDPDKLLDMASANNPVYFLGSSTPGKQAYTLTHAFEITFADAEISSAELDISQINSGKFKSIREDNKEYEFNLTYELSLVHYAEKFAGKPTWLRKQEYNYKASLEGEIQLLVEKTSAGILSEEEINSIDNDVDIMTLGNAEAAYLRQLLGILDISYATEYLKWFKVICAIAHTSHKYKDLAIWFSHRKPESWSPAEMDRVWAEATSGKFNRNPVTIGSIIEWARRSSPQAFAEIKKDHYLQVLSRHTFENEGAVEQAGAAATCYAMAGDKFVVDVGFNEKSQKMGYCWFEFVTPGQAMRKGEVFKWRKELDPDSLHMFISDHLPKVYHQLKAKIRERKDAAASAAELKYWNKVEKTFKTYTVRLGNDGFQKGIIRQAQYRFRKRGFCKELDSYPDVIGVGNGVLRLGVTPKLIKGYHEYKISQFTETDYTPYDPDNPYQKTLLQAYRDIFPEEDVFKFMLYHQATGLDARSSACIMLILMGGGANGKSFWAQMQHKTLGEDYCASGKPALLVSRIERPDAPNSAQMQMKGKRWFYLDEFETVPVVNVARLKAMVTPGYQSGRELRQVQENFENKCNPVALTNYDFIVDTTDHGTWRRIYYYKNKVTFKPNPNPNNPFEKKADGRFIDAYTQDPMYQQAHLAILVHYYAELERLYGGDLKKVPVPTIARETEKYRNSQDSLNRFITQYIVKSPRAAPIAVATVGQKYVEWYKQEVKAMNFTASEIQSRFESSRLSQFLELRDAGVYFLVGHRLRQYVEEPLEADESYLTADSAAPTIDKKHVFTPIPENERQLPRESPVKDDTTDDPPDASVPYKKHSELAEFAELERKAPQQIQHRDVVFDAEMEDIINAVATACSQIDASTQ